MTDQINARTWRGPSGLGFRHLVIEDTETTDPHALISVYRDGDGPGVLLDATQLREIAADLIARADLIDPTNSPWAVSETDRAFVHGRRAYIGPAHGEIVAICPDRPTADRVSEGLQALTRLCRCGAVTPRAVLPLEVPGD